ncbi:MAG: type II secretion system protein GspN [Nitrospirota bacterium]
MKRFLFVFVFAVLILFGFWLIVVPESLIINLIRESASCNDFCIETTDFRKGLFYNFKSQKVMLKRSGNVLLSVDNMAGRINPLLLFLMRPSLSFQGDIDGGEVYGKVGLSQRIVNIDMDGVNIKKIPLFTILGLKGEGVLSGAFNLKEGLGNLKFYIKDARFENSSFSGTMVPLSMFNCARGIFEISEDTIKIRSLSLEGRGIYARVKGNIREGTMDLMLELMRDSSFTEGSHIFWLIESYRVVPGYYVIPIRGKIPL